ncbi:TRAP transporter small permease [Marinovum sp.]|uniref:TRAP transporter small permease n=1 Tax=Marinovum sp. TaxID=2024839 RepID=UPI002B26B1C7|nr:TRAP transporter small permease [Marinovum sp.]
MKAARRFLDLIVGSACCLILAGMIVVLAWQVFSRYVLNTPSAVSEEVLRYGMIWSSLLGAALASGRGTHMSIELLRDKARGRARLMMELLVPLSFGALSLAVLIRGGLRAMEVAGTQKSAVLQIPMTWVYAAMPVGGVFILIYALLNLVDLLRGQRASVDEIDKALAAGD